MKQPAAPPASRAAARRIAAVALGLAALAPAGAWGSGHVPAPTLELLEGADGYVNGEEQNVMVRVSYDPNAVPAITSTEGRIVGTHPDDPPCAFGAPFSTTNQTSSVGDGSSFLLGPFDVSSFPEGIVLCARAFVRAGTETSAVAVSGTAVKDTIAPAAGAVTMIESVTVDGFLNLAEATGACCVAANWHHPEPATVSATQVWFEDADGLTTGGCGVFAVGASGSGSVNATCAQSMAQGAFRFLGRWFDQAGNGSPLAEASLIKDTLPPALVVQSPTDGAEYPPGGEIVAAGSTEPGGTVTASLDGEPLGPIPVAGDGSWSASVAAPDAEGVSNLVITATDPASNATSASFALDIITSLVPVIHAPAENGLVGATVTITGTGRPVSTVEIYEGERLVGSTQVSARGTWTVLSAFESGTRTIRARGVQDGTVSDYSAPRSFLVDAGPPTLEIGTGDGEIFPGGSALVEGIAGDADEGVARIVVEYYNLLGARAASGVAACELCGQDAAEVTWSHEAELPLPGLYTVVAWAEDMAGNRSVQRTIRILVA